MIKINSPRPIFTVFPVVPFLTIIFRKLDSTILVIGWAIIPWATVRFVTTISYKIKDTQILKNTLIIIDQQQQSNQLPNNQNYLGHEVQISQHQIPSD